VIIVASVSCIYGIGAVDEYEKQAMRFTAGKEYVLEAVITLLVSLQFKRVVSDEFHGGMFRLMGDTLEIWPSSSEEIVVLEFFGDELERISRKIPLTYEVVEDIDEVVIFPAKHFVTSSSIIEEVVPQIRTEMDTQVAHFLSL
jgi:excinuclease ABC subunit B